jgi:hypothetical protein
MVFPGCEVTGLGIVASVGQDHLDSDSYNFVVEKYDSGVIHGGLMEDRAANFGHDSLGHS